MNASAQVYPRAFYERTLGQFSRPDRHGWATPKTGCPFHRSQSRRSFRVNFQHGGWCCFAGCGRGDLIDFVKKFHRTDFKGALAVLHITGAEVPRKPKPHSDPLKMAIHRLTEAVIDGPTPNPERDYRLRLRDGLHRIERIHKQTSDRLAALLAGEPERFTGEVESLWAVLQVTADNIKMGDRVYRWSSGLPVEAA